MQLREARAATLGLGAGFRGGQARGFVIRLTWGWSPAFPLPLSVLTRWQFKGSFPKKDCNSQAEGLNDMPEIKLLYPT